jgi:hypothetical protein
MLDDTTPKDRLQQKASAKGLSGILQAKEPDSECEEGSCKAFGYLRGIRDQSVAVEFRFRDGNSIWFPYALLGPIKYNPSEGLLIKFSGDLVYLVLIKGSNLDKPLKDGNVTMIRAGLQRHRLIWVREMMEEEIRTAGDTEPTIDSIEVEEFESHDALKDWVSTKASAFAK